MFFISLCEYFQSASCQNDRVDTCVAWFSYYSHIIIITFFVISRKHASLYLIPLQHFSYAKPNQG